MIAPRDSEVASARTPWGPAGLPPRSRAWPAVSHPELTDFAVEFYGSETSLNEIIFRQPNGTFVAKRVPG
jgi:hypothetical protein